MPFIVAKQRQGRRGPRRSGDDDRGGRGGGGGRRAAALGVAAEYEADLEKILARQAEVLGTDVDTLLERLGPARLAQLVEQIDWDGAWEAPLKSELARMTKRELVRAGDAENERLGFRASFNVDNPQAIRYAREHVPELVREVTTETRQAIGSTVRRGYVENRTRDWIAKELRQIVGLTMRQASAVQTVRRAAEARGATPAQVDKAGERAYARQIRQRAQTIARTEIIRTSNAGTQMAWQEAKNAGALPATTRRQWIAGPGERTCPICGDLDGKKAGLEEPFASRFIGKVFLPPAHPNCRCTVGLTFDGDAAPAPKQPQATPATAPDSEVARQVTASAEEIGGLRKIERMREGMRPSSQAYWKQQYEGLDESRATQLAATLREPIRLRMSEGRLELIDGRHRLEAARNAGASAIRAVVTFDDGTTWTGPVPV